MAKGAKDREELDDLKGLEAQISKKRKPFPYWVMRHFDALTGVIERVGADWSAIAEWASNEGHAGINEETNEKNTIKPDAARKAYEREKARRDKLAKQTSLVTPVRPPAPSSTPIPVRLMSDPTPKTPKGDTPDPLKNLLEDMGTPSWKRRKGKE